MYARDYDAVAGKARSSKGAKMDYTPLFRAVFDFSHVLSDLTS